MRERRIRRSEYNTAIPGTRRQVYLRAMKAATERLRTRTWTRIKTAK